MIFFRSILIGLLFTFCLAFFVVHDEFSVDAAPKLQAFINVNVITMNDSLPRAEAILLEGDTIASVGSTREITKLVRSHSERSEVKVHDLSGKTLIPGFIDAHSHFPGSGIYEIAADLNAPPIGKIENISMLQTVLRSAVEQTSDEWILGVGYDDSLMRENRHPLKEELDAVSTSRPIFILHVSGHLGVAKILAMTRLGISTLSKPPMGGEYVKNREGQLTGLFLENTAFEALKKVTQFTYSQQRDMLRSAVQEYASQGVTTVQNGAADLQAVNMLMRASKLNKIPQRLVFWPISDEFEMISVSNVNKEYNAEKITFGAAKIIADGSIQGYTAYLTQPYFDPSNRQVGQNVQDYRGSPLVDKVELSKLVEWYFAKEQQVAIHGNGDASIDDILWAIEQAIETNPDFDHRTILVHAQMARNDQLKKMIQLGVIYEYLPCGQVVMLV